MVAVIRYNAGNIFSVECALRRLGVDPIVTNDPLLIATADKVIFPGVGEASSAMLHLQKHGLDLVIKNLQQPVLGICLGLQLLCRQSEENNTECLGIFPVMVKKFPLVNPDSLYNKLKVPHVGWNSIFELDSPLFFRVPVDSYLYFVHSFFAEISPKVTIASSNYIVPFSAALQKDNFYAVQFHPEKSGILGDLIYQNFLEL